jgi:hypothetical protein
MGVILSPLGPIYMKCPKTLLRGLDKASNGPGVLALIEGGK